MRTLAMLVAAALLGGVIGSAAAMGLLRYLRQEPPRVLAQMVDPESIGPVEEEIVDLPEDGQVWHTTLVYPANWQSDARSRQVAAFFATNSRLQSLLVQTKPHTYTADNKLYAERYARQMGGNLPQVWLQRGDGFVVYKAGGENLPASAGELADEIGRAIEQCCPQPTPGPGPQPGPGPLTPGPEGTVPDIRPIDEPGPIDLEEFPYWIVALPVLAVLLAVVVLQMMAPGSAPSRAA
jgi:hypothetical protein